MKKAVIIIPTYNEKENIEKLISLIEDAVFPKIKNYSMSILVADDSSPDGTGDQVKKMMEKWSNIDLLVGKKQGLGAAYIRAMTYAIDKMKADVVFEMDADFFHDPYKIPAFLEKIDAGYDFVVGTRYSEGGSIPKDWAFNRKFLSVFGNFIIRLVFTRPGIHDWTGGYRAIRKEVFLKEKEKLDVFKGYRFQVGFLHKAVQDGFKIAEVPFVAVDRTMGRSKMARGDTIVDTLEYVFYARFLELERFFKFLAVGGLGFVINAAVLRILVELVHWDPTLANLVGAALAIFSNYNLNNIWTFAEHRTKTALSYIYKMIQFYATSALGVIVIQTGTILLGDHFFGKKLYFIYFLIGTAFLLIWNFAIYSLVIWKKPQK